jgi:quercetin dioxygenase-like cupin family protein
MECREERVRIGSAMQTYRWDEIENEQLSAAISRQVIHADTMTLARICLKKGSVVPQHSHHNEQISTVEYGALKFVLGGTEKVVRAGDMLRIPPHVPHSVEALEDSVAVDLFSPRREDWIRGDDAYLRR